MLQEGLEHDHITANTKIVYWQEQLKNRNFVKKQMTNAWKLSYNENYNSCFETPVNSKITDSLLNNAPVRAGKITSRSHPHLHPLGNYHPLPSELPFPSVGGGGGGLEILGNTR